MTEIDLIEQIAEGDLSSEAFGWLAAGFSWYLAGDSLENALCLTSVHPRGARYLIAHRRVVRHLVAAAAMIPGSSWTRAKVLQSTIKLFRHRPGRAARNDIEREVIAALRAGPVPGSPQRLHGIIEANPPARLFSDQPT